MNSLRDFLGRLDEVATLLRYVAPEIETDSPMFRSSRRPFSDSTFARSCMVLMVSYFEGFLKDLADEAFDTLIVERIPCSKVASQFRGYVLSDPLSKLRAGKSPRDDWEAMASVIQLSSVLASSRAVQEELVPRAALKRAVTSIEPQKINELFKVFGDENLKEGPMSQFGGKLRSLKNIRDNAVHGNEADLTPLSLQDVLVHTSILRDCAKSMAERMWFLLDSFRDVPMTNT